jgi:hypothetical protein
MKLDYIDYGFPDEVQEVAMRLAEELYKSGDNSWCTEYNDVEDIYHTTLNRVRLNSGDWEVSTLGDVIPKQQTQKDIEEWFNRRVVPVEKVLAVIDSTHKSAVDCAEEGLVNKELSDFAKELMDLLKKKFIELGEEL